MSKELRRILIFCAAFAWTLLTQGWAMDDSQRSTADAAPAAATATGTPAVSQDASTGQTAADHDATKIPIDCPLRNQGIDSVHMRPFEEVEQYIAFLERPDRAAWQKPDEVIAALGFRGTETVLDLGAGSGYFSFRFAEALPEGIVIAADTEAEMIRHIHHRAMAEDVLNLEVKIIQPTDPAIPSNADLVFVCDVLHHVGDRAAWLSEISSAMKPGARLVLIEFKEGELPQGPPAALKIPRERIVDLVTNAGLRLASERAELLPYQTFLVFRKPQAVARE